MTKEELEKEAEEYVYDKLYSQEKIKIVKKAYVAGAEPREKQIAILEEQNLNLLAMLQTEREVRCNEEYLRKVTELEAENENLKQALECYKKIATWCDKCKAKEIIFKQKNIIEDVCDINFLSKDCQKTLKHAEQFLKEYK